jgi:SH3 domain protein
MMRYLLSVLLVSFLFTTAMAQSTLYVTDATKFAVRSGKSNQYKILRMVPSGTAVTVLEKTDDGYTRVRTPQGTEGWILSRYLDAVPSARDRLESLQSGYDELKAQTVLLKEQLGELETTRKDLQERNRDLQQQNVSLQQELEKVTQAAARPMEIAKQNEYLQQQLNEERETVQQLRSENQLLKQETKRKWFLVGAGVTLGSLFLGLIIPKIPWRRKRSWGEI